MNSLKAFPPHPFFVGCGELVDYFLFGVVHYLRLLLGGLELVDCEVVLGAENERPAEAEERLEANLRVALRKLELHDGVVELAVLKSSWP